MRETYIRPKWKAILYYLACMAGITAVSAVMAFFVNWGLTHDSMVMAPNTIFGPMPVWLTETIAFAILSPLLAFVIYWPMLYHKYDYEWRKLGLVPVDPEDPNRVLFEPRKINGKEPLWKENKEFEATIKLYGTKNLSTGRGCKTWMVVIDENGYKYLMDGDQFNQILLKMEDNTYHGKFIFDRVWLYPNLKVVE
jgi:hypothetical protein